VISGGAAAVLAGATVVAVVVSREAATQVPPAKPAHVNTATVIRTNLAQTETLPGTLGFGTQMTINGAGSGIITGLPAVGSVISRGQVLYRVDDQPVVVFYGKTPLFRTLAPPKTPIKPKTPIRPTPTVTATPTGRPTVTPTMAPPAKGETSSRWDGRVKASAHMTVLTSANSALLTGHDVTVVARNLAAMGYDIGPELPAPGGEASYTPALAAAVKDWQQRVGMTPTGTLGVGQVVVVRGPIRVAGVSAQLGDPVAGQLLAVSSTAKTVTVAAAATDLTSVAQGASAGITLPDGTLVPGTVTAIGQTVQSSVDPNTGQSGTDTYNITVTPLHQAQVANLQSAPVQVAFATSTRHSVLAVPVNALLALAGGGFALQPTNGSLIAVKTGLFANGMVQVTGTGVHAGLEVRSA
jgi:hypothetical protein